MKLVKRTTFCYYIALGVYCAAETFTYTMVDSDFIPLSFIYLLCMGLILIKVALTIDITARELIFWICGLSLGVFLYVRYGYTQPVIIVMFLLGAEKCSPDIIIKIHLYIVGTIVAIITILSQIGIVTDRVFYNHEAGIARHSMGMTYVTIWAAFIGFLLMEYIYLHRKDIKYRHIIIYVIIMLYSYIMTDTRVELALSIVFLFAVILYPFLKNKVFIRKKSALGSILAASFPIMAIVTCALETAYVMNPSRLQRLNSILSDRFGQTFKVLEQYPVNFLGQGMIMQGNGTVDFDNSLGYFFIDSMYLNYMVRFGILFVAFVAVVVIYFSYRLCKQKNFFLLFVLCLIAIHGFIISTILMPYNNVLYLVAAATLTKEAEPEGDVGWHWRIHLGARTWKKTNVKAG